MPIDPLLISTKRVGELPSAAFGLTDKLPREIGTELNSGTVQQLADTVGAYLGAIGGLAFNPSTVPDGGTLPATTTNEFMVVGRGTFHNVGGQPDIITTEELNVLTSNSSYWSLSVEVPVNVELAGITQNIRAGFTTTTPSENTVFNALATKLASGGYTGTAQDIITYINTVMAKPFPILFTAVATGTNQEFTLPAGFTAGSVLKSKGELFRVTEWSQIGTTLKIIININTGNTIYVKP